MSHRFAVPIALAICAVVFPVRAEDLVREAEPIVVEASRPLSERMQSDAAVRAEIRREPGSVGLVTEQAIDRTRAQDLEDVLQDMPGVLIRDRGVGEEPRISIRGSGLRNNFHNRGVNVLIDGFPFQSADGFSDVESFELLALKRIEVYKGANSLRFGGGSLGGAINLVTKTGGDAPLVGTRAEGGSFGFFKGYAESGLVREPWDVFGAASQTQGDGYRDHANGNRQRLYATIGREFDGGAALRIDLNGARSRADIPGPLTPPEFRADDRQADPESVRQHAARDFQYGRSAARLDVALDETKRLVWQAQFNYQDLWHPLPFAIIDNTTSNTSTELRFLMDAPLWGRDNRFSAGLQGAYTRQPQILWNNDGGERGSKQQQQLGNVTNVFLYAENEWSVAEAWKVLVGARAQTSWREVSVSVGGGDLGAVTFTDFSPRFGAIFDATPAIQLYGNLSHAFEPPVLFESTAPGNLDGQLDDLNAQRAWQFEIGARGRAAERVEFEAAIYDTELRDEIRNLNVVPFPGAPFTIPRYENARKTRHWGAELGANVEIVDWLHFYLAYTFSDFRYVDDAVYGDNRLPGEPAHNLVVELRFQHPLGFWFTPELEVASQYFEDSANSRSVDPYTLFGFRMGYDHAGTGLGVFFEARNLTNQRYVSVVQVDTADDRYIEPGDGRAFYGGLSWRWQ